jgi:hypothetical protein
LNNNQVVSYVDFAPVLQRVVMFVLDALGGWAKLARFSHQSGRGSV